MTSTTKNVIKLGNMNIHFIPSKKFKTITFELKFIAPLDQDTITKRALLPLIIKKGSKNYPSDTLIQSKLDNLYGASLQINGFKVGANHVINVEMELANEKFISNESTILADALTFLNEVVAHPNIENGQFPENIVVREKETIRNHIHAIKDNKMGYANIRLLDEMGHGEAYSIHAHGYEEDLEQINGISLYGYYQEILKNDRVDLFVVGDFDREKMKAALKEHLTGIVNSKPSAAFPHFVTSTTGKIPYPKEVIEKDQLQQAQLLIGYRTRTTFRDSNFAGMLVTTMILGGYPGSKLFVNVREKHSLAYYVSAGWDSFSDKLIVYSGIAPEASTKAQEITEEQVQALKEGEFTEEELNSAKTLLIGQVKSSTNTAAGMIDMEYRQLVSGKERSKLDLIEEIQSVQKQEVIHNANKLQADTVYLLTSKEVQ